MRSILYAHSERYRRLSVPLAESHAVRTKSIRADSTDRQLSEPILSKTAYSTVRSEGYANAPWQLKGEQPNQFPHPAADRSGWLSSAF
jgi:hypothetical protein